jgi:hypothetical protein
MSLARRLAVLAIVPGVLLSTHPVRAQTASDKAAAEALFREGRRLLDAGQYPQACAKLAESQKLDPAPGTLLNLAGCYEKNGQTASAWATFKEAQSASQQKGHADWAELARTRAAALEANLSRLTITVATPAPDGLQVTRDGAVVGSAEWGTPIPVDPGAHVVEATAPHHATFHQSVQVTGAGASQTLAVPALAEDTTPIVSPGDGGAAPASHGSTQRMIGLVVAGVGVVGIAVGSVFGVVAMNKENDATQHDCTGNFCNSTGVQLGNDAHTAATVSTVAFGVGAAALAGGLVLYFLAPKDDATPTVGFRAAGLPGGGELGVTGAW